MSRESISRLAALTGMARETVAKRLAELTPFTEGSAKKYESKDALPILYGFDSESSYDLTEERARLAKWQADKIELKVAELEGTLLSADKVETEWTDLVTSFRARILALPSKIAPVAMAANTVHDVEEFARDEIHRALDELADAESNQKAG